MADKKPAPILTDEAMKEAFDAADDTKMTAILDKIEKEVSGHEADLSTGAKRAEITALSSRVGSARQKIDAFGKSLSDDMRAQINAINARRTLAKDRLAALKETVRAPLTKWEECEAARKEAHEATIREIEEVLPNQGATVAEVEKAIERLDEICTVNMQEYQEQADAAKARTMEALNQRLATAKESEEREAELEALRAEKAEREQADQQRREQEAQARRDAEAEEARRVEAERIREEERVKAQRETEEANARAEKAEREAAEAIERERAEREAAEKAEAEAEKQRKQDADHRMRIVTEATTALIDAGISKTGAGKAVAAIMAGTVPHISIKF